jgi:hypothetical protein
MAGSRRQTSSKLIQRAFLPAALLRKADGGSMVLAAALSGMMMFRLFIANAKGTFFGMSES